MKTMEYKGFKAQIMRAARLTGDYTHTLPPGNAIDIYPVDSFEKPLPSWIPGQGNYVIPVNSEDALWFDWTMNDGLNTCVLPTVKGMNPITGRRTNGFALERYENKCPDHNIEFKDGLYCEKCDFKWPVQNYVTYPNTLWWDGFRTSDGKVRQFFFTEDMTKSIPEKVIGKDDTIPAFGFAFYRPKVTRAIQAPSTTRNKFNSSIFELKSGQPFSMNNGASNNLSSNIQEETGDQVNIFACSTGSTDANPIECSCDASPVDMNDFYEKNGHIDSECSGPISPSPIFRSAKRKVINKEVGVGAGAEIFQDLKVDTLKLTDWEEKPSSVMRLYFVFTEQFNRVADKGFKNLNGQKEGYLNGLVVG